MDEIREEFFDVLKDQILVQRMQGTIADGLNVTPQDVKEFYEQFSQKTVCHLLMRQLSWRR